MLKKIVFIMMVFSLLTGCWSRKELTDLAIVSAMGIDKVDEQYILTVQVINPGDIAGKTLTTRVAVSTYKVTGKSIIEAIRKLTKNAPRKLYFAHLRLLVIGEKLAREGISNSLELISRDHEFRTDFYILVAQDHPSSAILNVLTPIEKNPANKVFNTIEVSLKNWAPTAGVKLDELINNLTATGTNPVLTGIIIKGNEHISGDLDNVEEIPSAATLTLGDICIFKKDQLIGWLDQEESKGYNYIKDNIESTVAVVDWKGGKISIEILNSTTKHNVKITNSGKPKIIIDVQPEAQIAEVQGDIDLTKEEEILEVEKLVNARGNMVVTRAIQRAQEYKSDVFGLGELIHRKHPKLWKTLEKTWHDEGFTDLDYEVNFHTTIRRVGTTNDSFLNEMEDTNK
ncbi:Ger(x)C family spore germination protein [Metabacillus sp. HB246100]